MSQYWSQVTRELSPYVPGEQPQVPNLIKLNTNEHPLLPSARAMTAIQSLAADALRRYPDPEASKLRQAIATAEGLAPEQVFVGNGSDEVLAHVFQALISAQSTFTTLNITYSFYPVWARLYGLELRTIALREDFSVDVDQLCQAAGPILIANPNAPTGIALSDADLRRIVASDPNRLVVVDEAYFGFGANTASALITEANNLLVTRTLSKSHALAGLRVGYALGSNELIEGLVRVKDSFNSYPLDALAQAGATAAVEDQDWLVRASAEVVANRDRLTSGLTAMGFEVCPSKANFVFARHPAHSGKALFDGLRAANILVRRWDKAEIQEYLRITVGTSDQCDALLRHLDALTRYLN